MDRTWDLYVWHLFHHLCNHSDLHHHVLEKCEKIPAPSSGQIQENYTETTAALSMLNH